VDECAKTVGNDAVALVGVAGRRVSHDPLAFRAAVLKAR
jgi:hypothetical protein